MTVRSCDSKELRDSYLALSLEYERLAVLLERVERANLLTGANRSKE
jgi:hypothetical protein